MNFNKLVSKKEKIYFAIMLVISLLLYSLLILTGVGILYFLIFVIVIFYTQGIAIGYLKQNSIKVTDKQFADIDEKVISLSNKIGLEKVPDVYITQSGGILNAYATRFCLRNFIVLYSDVLELAYEEGQNAVDFIIAHELAHIKRGHLTKMKYIACAAIIPYLNAAYSRACETTCDNIATIMLEKAPTDGLLAILAGKKLYKNVNVSSLIKTAESTKDYWCWVAEIYSTHPPLIQRIKNIRKVAKHFNISE